MRKMPIGSQYVAAEMGHVSLTDTYRGLDALLDRHAPKAGPSCLRACGFADADEVRIAAKRMEIAVCRREYERRTAELKAQPGPKLSRAACRMEGRRIAIAVERRSA